MGFAVITEIHMDKVASFTQASSLATDKKINLIYGLNGTGKSTISSFLYAPDDARFANCKTISQQPPSVLVYNQKFIQDNFFVADNLKGIFSLSKENKEAEEKIAKATAAQVGLELSLQGKRDAKSKVTQDFDDQKQKAIDQVWEIKTKYSGGDRVLEYCLEGLMGKKDKLFSYLQEIKKSDFEPKKSVQTIRDEVDALKGDTALEQPELPLLIFVASSVEYEAIFTTAILGNADSEVAALIDSLGNSDWVNQGLAYLPEEIGESGQACPFCQAATITSKFAASIRGYFDDTYWTQIESLEKLKKNYADALGKLEGLSTFTSHPFARERAEALAIKYQALLDNLRRNVSHIDQKIKTPKLPRALEHSATAIADFNQEVALVNQAVIAYNNRLKHRKTSLDLLKAEFWSLMRWQYDQTMARFEADRQSVNQKLKGLDDEVLKLDAEVAEARTQIALAQKETVNVDEAVKAINDGLADLGIDGFSVSKHSERLYRVVRKGESAHAFQTLSEGEKMMISFLYFCELCKGKLSPDETHSQRVAVIDDPISSLSHIFVFNVGQLIRSVFFKNDQFSQVFVLTHSLYFFYELTDTNHERRKLNQKLFRISKSSAGSVIQDMKYEEIQNDYQAYWNVINDQAQPPALIANCMRNIVEYFFSFVKKRDLNNVFLAPELQTLRLQAFSRYINRESHSVGQNIFDMKEFDYDAFKEGLKLVFEKSGFPDHFKEMSKI
jgi:wobble nucleotide-excising tRNase